MTLPIPSNPPTVSPPVGAYSHVVQVKAGSDLFYIAGQVGLTPEGVLPPSLEEQAEQAFANIARILMAEGMTAANLVKLNLYIVMGHPAATVRAARIKALGADIKAASTLVYVPQLVEPKYLVEVEAVAAR